MDSTHVDPFSLTNKTFLIAGGTRGIGRAISVRFARSEKLIGDKAYDSDPLNRHLEEKHAIEMIAPNRENRNKTQDGRGLRRYLRRWVA